MSTIQIAIGVQIHIFFMGNTVRVGED